jgi:hypothetical protein
VVQHFGASVHDGGQGGGVAAEIGDQQFDGGLRCRPANGLDARHELGGSAVGQVVPVDRSDHHMAQGQPCHGGAEPLRFRRVEGADAAVEINVAVRAGAGAARAHDQEGRCAAGEALADVGTAGLLADGVELQVQQQICHRPDALPLGSFHTQPVGFRHGGLLG